MYTAALTLHSYVRWAVIVLGILAIVRAARGCHLLVNAAPAVFNEIVLRAALRLRAHYLDLAAHLISRDEAPASIERGGRKAHPV